MRKLLVSTLAVVGFATVAVAQESVLVFDIRNNTVGNQSIATPLGVFANGQNVGQVACNGGRLGDGQVLRIMPTHAGNALHTGTKFPNFDADANSATGDLNLWLVVKEDTNNAPACVGDVISSVGVDFNVTSPGAPKNVIGSMAWTWSAAVTWNGTANGVYAGGNNGNYTGAKAVDVPVNATPAYDTTGGAVPGGGEVVGLPDNNAYRVGALRVTGGARNCTFAAGYTAASTYTIKMAVNNLLITRTCSNASVDAGELVAMGYGDPSGASLCGSPGEAPAVNGSTSGATSAAPDAVVIVAEKGDFNNNGNVTGADNGGFGNAQVAGAAITQNQLYLGEFNGNATVTGADNGGYGNAQNNTAVCP